MPWLLIKFSVPSRHVDILADALSAAGALSVSIENATVEQRLQAVHEQASPWSRNLVTGLFPADADTAGVVAAVRQTPGIDTLARHQVRQLDDADWARAWMASYQPQRVASNLWITPSWCDPPDPTAINVVLDPGLAFGTGTHPTTRLCLEWLATQPLAGRTVIDYGCGSGILAVAALKLGAARAVGVDVDPQALAVSHNNAERNGVAAGFRACLPGELPAGQAAQVLVANILSETLIAHAHELTARTEPNGRLALSGILPEQAAEVRAVYRANFDLERHTRDGWVLLAGRRIS